MAHVAFVSTKTLFNSPSPRPLKNEAIHLELAARRLSSRIEQWCIDQGDDFFDEEDYEDLVKTIVDNYSYWYDGHILCKRLESYFCMDGDVELVEICDAISFYHDTEYDKEVKRWVKDNGIELSLSVGDVVEFTREKISGPSNMKGEILSVGTNLAEYCIHCPSEGHVKIGVGTRGYIVKCEEILRVIKEDDVE